MRSPGEFGHQHRLLLTMATERDTPDTAEIWRLLSDRLRRFIRRRVAVDADVDDLLQEVFLRIHQKRDGLRRADRLESWVFQIARSTVADHGRRIGRDPVATATADEVAGPPTEADMHGDVARCLGDLVAYLPEDQRRAVALYEFDGVPQKQIAAMESISLSAAKSRVQRGRARLEEMLLDCCRFQFDRRGNVLDVSPASEGCCDEDGCRPGA